MDEIVIIGAGMGGLTLALALQAHHVPVRVYESRPASAGPTLGGGMMFSPNALSLLDQLGVYSRIRPLSYALTRLYFKNSAGKTVETFPMGDPAVYKYPALRVFRRDLHQVLTTLCTERGIPIEYNVKYTSIVSESDAGVTFTLSTGETRSARLLIGADGIHSAVRAHVTSLTPIFGRSYAIAYAVPTSRVRVPASSRSDEFPQVISTQAGAFLLVPQTADGSEMMAGSQFPWPTEGCSEPTREEWAALAANTEKLKALLRDKANYDGCPDIVRSALEEIKDETMYIWPFYMLPRLPTLSSSAKRVVLMGDAAHALPPTTGQGAGMAIEDAATLARIIAAAYPHSSPRTNTNGARAALPVPWESALSWWEATRQNRLDDLVDLTDRMNRMRLPAEKLAQLSKDQLWVDESESNPRQMAWLYAPGVLEEVEEWIKAHNQGLNRVTRANGLNGLKGVNGLNRSNGLNGLKVVNGVVKS